MVIQSRVEAIRYAARYAAKGDVVLVAGKGCEKYQEILGIKHLYNDKDCIEKIYRETGNEELFIRLFVCGRAHGGYRGALHHRF